MALAALKNDDLGTVLNDTLGQGKILRLFADRINHAAAEVSALPVDRDQIFARSFVYSPETASLFERADDTAPDFGGGNVQVLESRDGWRTYNFEVEDLHTYIAGNFRVHNDSAATLVVADAAYKNLFGSEFDATPASIDKLMGALSDGSIEAYGEYTALLSDDRFTTVAYDSLKDKIVMTIEKGEWNVTTWRDGLRLETRTIDPATGKAVMVHVGRMTTTLGDGAAGKGTIAINEKQQIDYIITEALGKLNYTGAVAALGSSIGNAIAGDNFAAKIATSSLLSTFLANFAASLGAGPSGAQTVSLIGENGAINITQIVDATFKDFNLNLAGNIRSQVVGALSSILMGELSEALGLNGVTKGIFNTVASTAVSTIGDTVLKNIATMIEKNVFSSADLFKGLTTGNIADQINGAIHSYLGSELGQALVVTKTPEATLFASATASILSTLLSSFGPIGNFIGSAVGRAIGGVVGREIFDKDMNVSLLIDVNKLTGALKPGTFITVDATDNEKQLGKDLANRVIDDINKFIVENKFHIDTDAVYTPIEVGLFADWHNVRRLKADGVTIGTLDQSEEVNKQSFAQALYKAEGAVFKNLSLLIEDPLIRRAYYAGHEDGVAQMSMDIKVAQDYLKYLEDAAAINALMRQDMTSKFSVGWSLTILRARELGLDQVSASDFHGGFYVNLKDHDVVQGPRGAAAGFAPERMAWIPDFEASDLSAEFTNTGSLLLRSADGLSAVTAENVFAPGKLNKVEGENNTDAVDARKVSSELASLVFVKAGSGDKTVYGSEKWGSIVVGDTGKQTLIGGAGNDWLRAGDNNVALIGGAGDDLLVAGAGAPIMDGGKGRNTYILGPDGADVKISAIDPNGSDTIVAVTSGARVESNIIDITARSSDGHAVYSNKTAVIGYEPKSTFDRSGSDLVITTVSGYLKQEGSTDEYGNFNYTGDSFYADTAKGKIVVKNFFLTDSGIDQIKFSDGTSFTNKEIWNEAKVTIRVDDGLWNSNDATSTNTVIDTTNSQAGFLAQQTTTYNGNNVFIAFFSDDGTMWTNSFDPLAHHDWQKWETAYKADGSISAEAVTFGVKDASGNFIKIYRGVGGMVAGGVGDDVLLSASAGSTLIGDRGDDDLSGSGGTDLLYGGSGDDRYTVGAGDQVFEYAGQGTDIVEATVSYTLASGQSIEVLRLAASTRVVALDLTGNELNNTLVGNDGINVLNGGAGNDVMQGGGGNDTYIVDTTGDKVQERAEEGIDSVRTALTSHTLSSDVENLLYTGSAAFAGTGNELDNSIVGGNSNDTLIGGAGDDTLDGSGGTDTLRGGTGDDTYRVDTSGDLVFEAAGQGTDTILAGGSFTLAASQEIEILRMASASSLNDAALTGNEFANTLIGNAAANTLIGNAGSDVLDGGAGADRIEGGDGIDTVSYASAKRQVSVDLSKNTAWDGASDTITAIENATGSVFNDTLVGDAGTNVLDGGDGDDILKGGLGNDVYVVDSASDTVTEVAGEGTDEVRTDLSSYTLAAETEILRYTGTAAFVGSGNGLANTLYGGIDADSLNGGAGNDVMRGGTGNDTYYADNAGDQVFEATGQGYDTVVSQNSFTLAAGQAIEVLRLTATNVGRSLAGNEFDNVITGNAGDNGLWGNAGNDTIDGGDGGADAIDGGDGRDTVSYVSSSRKVTIALNDKLTWDGEKNDTLVSIENAIGSAFDDVLGGDANANVLNGGAGADTMRGGLGDDTYAVDNAGDQVLEKAGEGSDVIVASISYGIATGQEIERIQLASATGAQALNLYGNELNNVLWGNAGNNTLDGRAGADQMDGNLGNDTYGVDNVGDTVIEAANEGTDTIIAGNTNYTLAAGVSVEVMRFANSVTGDFDLTGNELNNDITGTAGNNILIGNAGNDILRGREGDDVYSVDSAGDQVIEGTGQGNDAVIALTSYKLQAGQEIETLQLATATAGASLNLEGNEFANSLSGNSGANRLNGGGGSDTLWGKGGADSFVFNTALGSGNLDTIVDFVSGEDRIVLDNSVMAVLPTGALAASAFKNLSQGAADADDRIIYNQTRGDLWYDADGSGSVAGVRIAVLENKGALTYQDILVV